MCVSGCPYKKVYFNWQTGKAEKCTLCYPRLESGQPTVCSETCVGRIRYLGVVLYDADRVEEAASVRVENDLLAAQLVALPRPERPRGARAGGARRDRGRLARGGAPLAGLHARRRTRVALPLHPEYRTLPMVWYVPPLSPVMSMIEGGAPRPTRTTSSRVIDELRIPVKYLANMLTAGDEEPVRLALKRLAAMRSHMRERGCSAASLTP